MCMDIGGGGGDGVFLLAMVIGGRGDRGFVSQCWDIVGDSMSQP